MILEIAQWTLLGLVFAYSTMGWVSYIYDFFLNKKLKTGGEKVFQVNDWKFKRMTDKLKDDEAKPE